MMQKKTKRLAKIQVLTKDFTSYKIRYKSLKVVPATFLLVCFVCLKESICETRENAFYFILKALFVLEIIKF